MNQVHLIPILNDNYSFVITKNSKALIVDPGEGKPLIEFLEKRELRADTVLITHHHSDHIGGLDTISKKYNISVICPKGMNPNVPYEIGTEGTSFSWEGFDFKIMELPGHTLDHIAFYEPNHHWLFSGDVLFGLGCGRIFEGTYEMMYASLNKIKTLPKETKIFCGHEYTQANCEFVNQLCEYAPFKAYQKELVKKRGKSIPLLLNDELIANPFLLTNNDFFQEIMMINDPFMLFKKLRELRNQQ